jgi:dCMP deaminase
MSNSKNNNNFIKKLEKFSHEKRLEWDEYFMSTAVLISSRSSCDRLKVGCVIVKDKRIISSGYNGHLPGETHISIIKDNHEQATIHAECNAIADCANRGVNCKDATIYITHYPCINCFKIIAASGIKHIIYLNDYKNNDIINKLSKNIIIDKLNI